jgi:hypothetical protein
LVWRAFKDLDFKTNGGKLTMKNFVKSISRSASVLSLLAMVLALAPVSSNAKPRHSINVVVDGLHSPRGLSMGAGNTLYAAQAGDAENLGSIIEIRNSMSNNATYRTVASNLLRVGGDGEFLGVSGISVLSTGRNQNIYAIMGISPGEGGDPLFGSLLRFGFKDSFDNIANVGEFGIAYTTAHPDPMEPNPDSNPYGVLAIPGHVYVADAGGNLLDEVFPDGSIQAMAYFPDEIIRDAIPTCVAQGPDGALYVGTLALVDSIVLGPSAKVWRIDPATVNTTDPTLTPKTLWAQGLYPVNGCTFGPDGNFYASQLFTNDFENDPRGDVVMIPFSSPGTHNFLTNGALGYAGGIAAAPNGDIFVADGTSYTPNGKIVRISH